VPVPKATCSPTTGKLAKVSQLFNAQVFMFYYLTKLISPNNNSKKKSISDIDECDYDPDNDQDRLCPGLCRNTIGSYICIDEDEEIEEFEVTCQPGFEANNNGQCLGLFDIPFNRFIQCCDTLFFYKQMLTSAFPRTTEVVRTFAQTQTAHLLVSVRPDSFLKRTTGRAKVFLFLLLFYGARLFST